ncbi:MAG TPA: phosphotransferase [Steroidobacteraceae bacterium]|nr:phosphotransferase [Steroidobacteraceae bacterium]
MPDDLTAFMATMRMPSRPLSVAGAVRVVRDHYGIEASGTRLTGERDENFRIRSADGGDYVLKVAHPAEDPAISDLTTAALLHLESRGPVLPCPRVVRERGGRTHVRFIDELGVARSARLLSYLPGSPLVSAAASQRLRAACGRLGGRLTRALSSFTHPAARRAIVWDVRYAAHLAGLLEQVPGFPCRGEAIAVLERIVPRIDSRLAALRHQIVHNDLNPRNILVTSTGEISGIIDFGDMTYTAVIADVAVTAAEQLPEDCTVGKGAAAASVLDVANAYHEELPLLPPELAMLGTLVAARLVANLVVHEWHVHRNPAGEHYQPLTADFIGRRLAIATELSFEAVGL